MTRTCTAPDGDLFRCRVHASPWPSGQPRCDRATGRKGKP